MEQSNHVLFISQGHMKAGPQSTVVRAKQLNTKLVRNMLRKVKYAIFEKNKQKKKQKKKNNPSYNRTCRVVT